MSAQTARLVARREFIERGRERSFFITTGVMVALVVIIAVAAGVLNQKNSTPSFSVAFTGPLAASAQPAALATAQAEGIRLTATIVTDESAAEAQVRAGKLDAVVGPDAITVRESLDPKLGPVLQAADKQAVTAAALTAAGIDVGEVARAAATPALPTSVLAPTDPRAGERKGFALVTVIILFLQLIMYCTAVAMGVIEEKSTRIVEVLLAAVPARSLLVGKVLGIGGLGFLQLVAITGVGLGASAATGAVHLTTPLVQAALITLAWFVLGFAFYASAFAAVASRVSRQEELQGVLQPLSLLLTASYLVMFPAISNPDAPWVRVIAMIPPFSTLLQPVRMAGANAPWWEPVGALVLMVGLTALVITVGARIYENSVLRFGTRVSYRTAWAGRRAYAVGSD